MNNPHKQFPGKMDKMSRKTYKKGYKKAKHGNVKDGYAKLKHVKLFENFDINETGEWDRDMNWKKVKGMDQAEIDRSEEASWIKALETELMNVQDMGAKLEIQDIQGFDKYQGPYAMVEFKGPKGGKYKVWTAENDELFIEDHPEKNTDRGFVGTAEEVANLFM